MLRKAINYISEYLRIAAIRRIFAIADVRQSEAAGLIGFALLSAVFEGVGLGLLIPVLQYAEATRSGAEPTGAIFSAVERLLGYIGVPLTMWSLLVLAFIPIILRQIVWYTNAWYSAVVSSKVAVRMRLKCLNVILDADPEFFGRRQAGELVGVVLNQSGAAGGAVLQVIKMFSVTLLLVLYVTILFAISWQLTFVAVFFAFLVSWLVRTNIRKIGAYGVIAARMSQQMYAGMVERFGMMTLIKLRDQARVEAKHLLDLSNDLRTIAVKNSRLGARSEVTADPLLMASVFLTLYIGIEFLGMTLAELGMLLFVLNRVNARTKEFNSGRMGISGSMGGIRIMREVTEDAAASNTIRRGPVVFEGVNREIVLDDVRFDYPEWRNAKGEVLSAGTPVLHGISATIPAGSFTAIVGRSGAGKSTLVTLLVRFREATGGSIEFDGTDVKEFDVGTLRTGVGYLSQSAMLFGDTIRNNLTYGLGFEASDDQIRDALERAHADFVYNLPLGLDTVIGERGVRFSGGERQRLGLARVLLEDTTVLILDEPTSALDSESEGYIQDTLAQLHGHKTVIVIAHRLATVIKADQLIVIDRGRVVERGTHQELVAQDGVYHKLFKSQLIK